jgi:hypothetical protein
MQSFRWQATQKPSARLTHGPKPEKTMWLLRCSVLRETPMASAIHFKKLNGCSISYFADKRKLTETAEAAASEALRIDPDSSVQDYAKALPYKENSVRILTFPWRMGGGVIMFLNGPYLQNEFDSLL